MTADQTPAGATPAAPDATPGQTAAGGASTGTPGAAQGSTTSTDGAAGTPATGQQTDAPLGEPGKKALDAERDARKLAEDRAKKAEAELKKLTDAQLSETEKKDKRLAELEREQADWTRERQEITLAREVERRAAKLGFADPGDALGLLDRSTIEFEENGTPKNLDPLLAALAKAKPYLLAKQGAPAPGSADQGARGGGGTAGEKPTTLAAALEKRFAAGN